MQNRSSDAAAATGHVSIASTTLSKTAQLFAAFILGVVFIYGAGFVQTSAVHNAAHDARHSLGFPCH